MASAVVGLENDVEELANELTEVTMQTKIVNKAPTNFVRHSRPELSHVSVPATRIVSSFWWFVGA
jgi:hypothetical protein